MNWKIVSQQQTTLVVISDPLFKQGKFFLFFLPFDFVVRILEYRSVFWLVIIFLIDN